MKRIHLYLLVVFYVAVAFYVCACGGGFQGQVPEGNTSVIISISPELKENAGAKKYKQALLTYLSKYADRIQVIDADDLIPVEQKYAGVKVTILQLRKELSHNDDPLQQAKEMTPTQFEIPSPPQDPKRLNEYYDTLRKELGDYDATYGVRVFSPFHPKEYIVFTKIEQLFHFLRLQ